MSQTNEILKHMQQGNTITPIEALSLFNCFRLGARIKDLRDSGHAITTHKQTENGKTFARYELIGE